MIAQFVLGYMHHRIYKRTQSPTKLAPIHVWLGRVVIPAGIANGFLGFPLALNSKYNWALLALILLVIIVLGPFSFWRWRRNSNRRKTALAVASDSDDPAVYQAQPWNAGVSRSDINLSEMNYPPENYPSQSYPPQNYENPAQGRQFV
jgi:hypothetical protein